MALRARATPCSNNAGSGRICLPTRSTAASPSRAGFCRARTSRSTTRTASPPTGPTTCSSFLGTCVPRSPHSCSTCGTGAGAWSFPSRRSRWCEMKVVLFCGGLGMRMREGPRGPPNPMNGIGDRPLLWHVMRYYAHFGHNEFILCLGYGAAAVKDYFVRYDETQSNDFTLVGGGRDITMHSTDITD